MFAELSDAVQITNAVLSFLSVILAPVVAYLVGKLRAKDAEIEEQRAKAKDSASVAADAVRVMQVAVDRKREAEGLPAVKPMADVKPEHQSPVTEAQAATAQQATLRAAVTAAALELGVAGRAKPPAPTDAEGDAVHADAELISKAAAVAAVLAIPAAADPAAEPEKKEG